jgi:phenylacetate-CoA ligase
MKDKIYNFLPVFLQNIVISLFGYYWHKVRFGGIFESSLKEFKAREFYTKDQWDKYQINVLNKLLIHSISNVPFYQRSFTKLGINLSFLNNLEIGNLKELPFLEKNDLRLFCESDLLAVNRDIKGAFYSSSGSTGTPTKVYISKRTHQMWSAVFESRIRNWAGLTIKNPRGMIGGRRIIALGNSKGPFYRFNYVEKQVYFSAYHISRASVANYLKGISKFNLDYMTGYAMSNFILARFIKEAGLKGPKLKAVITSSEKLTSEMRQMFEKVYGCKTFDSYSGVEACGLISECEHGKLHLSPDVGIVEIIKEDGEYAKPGEIGEAVCTGLLNFDQPLIRYRIGDLFKLSGNQSCKCGRNMPIIEEIIGRVEDTVIGKDGREMVRFHGIFVDMPNIIEGQIIQHTISDFEIVIATSESLNQEERNEILRRMESQLGTINLKITQVDIILRNRNGKFKAVVSHVKNNK